MAAHNNQGERGSALVLVLIFCAALLILGGALSTLTLNDNFIAANQVEDSRPVSYTHLATDPDELTRSLNRGRVEADGAAVGLTDLQGRYR